MFKVTIFKKKREKNLYDTEYKYFDTKESAISECEKIEEKAMKRRSCIAAISIDDVTTNAQVYSIYLG